MHRPVYYKGLPRCRNVLFGASLPGSGRFMRNMYRFIIKIYRDETLRAFFVVDLFFIVIKITPMENKSIKIRRATTKDIPELLVLLRESFQ
jgi:hypothetical protein